MTLELSDIEMAAELPSWPRSMPVYTVQKAEYEERRPAIAFLQEALHLGKVKPVEIKGSLHLMSPAGEIQYYRPSGALWAQNIAADKAFEDERRPWKVEKERDETDPDNYKLVLAREEQEMLAELTAGLFNEAGLMSEQATFAGVELDQVASRPEKRGEEALFAGEANVRFLYRLENVPVDGAGAKSYAFFNPGEEGPVFSGLFHVWRRPVGATSIQMVGAEEALARVLARDRELAMYHDKGYAIKLNQVRLVYYAMPPFEYQEYVYPALEVFGFAVPRQREKRREGFGFARFYNAAPPKAYIQAELFADYLLSP